MKKFLVLMFVSMFLVCGCGKSKDEVVCTGKVNEDGYEVEMKLIAKLKNDKVSSLSASMTFADESTANTFCGYLGMANSFAESEDQKIDYECSGKTLTIKDYTKLESDGDSEFMGLTRDEFIKKASESEDGTVTCK